MKTNTRLAGHELRHEGRVWNGVTREYGNGSGVTACTCGVESPYLPSTNARKRWHREHKDAVRAAMDTRRNP